MKRTRNIEIDRNGENFKEAYQPTDNLVYLPGGVVRKFKYYICFTQVIFSQYFLTSWSLLFLSPFDWHERSHGLSNKGDNCARSKIIVLQKFLIVKVSWSGADVKARGGSAPLVIFFFLFGRLTLLICIAKKFVGRQPSL